jgi:hypothetical protein
LAATYFGAMPVDAGKTVDLPCLGINVFRPQFYATGFILNDFISRDVFTPESMGGGLWDTPRPSATNFFSIFLFSIFIYCVGAGEKLQVLVAPIRGLSLCYALAG